MIDLNDVIFKIKRFFKGLKRGFAFFKIGFNNHDWDYDYLHELVLFKLKRMYYEMENFGYHSPKCSNYKPKMKSLKLTIKLLERYIAGDDKHYCGPLLRHDEKWGEMKTWSVPVDSAGNEIPEKEAKLFRWMTSRPNAITEEEKEQERKEFLEAFRLCDTLKQRDIRNVYHIIAKYHNYWWD